MGKLLSQGLTAMNLKTHVYPLWFLESRVGAMIDRSRGTFTFPDDDGPGAFTTAVGAEIALVAFTTEANGRTFASRLGVSSASVSPLTTPRELRDLANRFRSRCSVVVLDPETPRQAALRMSDVLAPDIDEDEDDPEAGAERGP
jgi:hypothetical protein